MTCGGPALADLPFDSLGITKCLNHSNFKLWNHSFSFYAESEQ
jgi:hypothetical protein